MEDIKIGLSIEEAAELTGIGRTRLFQEIKEGRLIVAKVGRRTIVPVARLEQWLTDRESQTTQTSTS